MSCLFRRKGIGMKPTYLVFAQIGTGSSRFQRHGSHTECCDFVVAINLAFGSDCALLKDGDVHLKVDKAFMLSDYVGLNELLKEAAWSPVTKVGYGTFIENLIRFSNLGV